MEKEKNYKQIIKNFRRNLVHKTAEINFYGPESISGEDFKKQYKEFNEIMKGVDYTKYSAEELLDFGFSYWDEDLILIPLWLIDTIEKGTIVYSISGKEIIVEDNLDKDARFGATAYGFNRSQLRDSKLEEILN